MHNFDIPRHFYFGTWGAAYCTCLFLQCFEHLRFEFLDVDGVSMVNHGTSESFIHPSFEGKTQSLGTAIKSKSKIEKHAVFASSLHSLYCFFLLFFYPSCDYYITSLLSKLCFVLKHGRLYRFVLIWLGRFRPSWWWEGENTPKTNITFPENSQNSTTKQGNKD